MVQGRVWLCEGGMIRIQATDMLSALKMATAAYDGRIKRMELKTQEDRTNGRCEVDQAGNRFAGQQED